MAKQRLPGQLVINKVIINIKAIKKVFIKYLNSKDHPPKHLRVYYIKNKLQTNTSHQTFNLC
jgi:hypothetical protein